MYIYIYIYICVCVLLLLYYDKKIILSTDSSTNTLCQLNSNNLYTTQTFSFFSFLTKMIKKNTNFINNILIYTKKTKGNRLSVIQKLSECDGQCVQNYCTNSP